MEMMLRSVVSKKEIDWQNVYFDLCLLFSETAQTSAYSCGSSLWAPTHPEPAVGSRFSGSTWWIWTVSVPFYSASSLINTPLLCALNTKPYPAVAFIWIDNHLIKVSHHSPIGLWRERGHTLLTRVLLLYFLNVVI